MITDPSAILVICASLKERVSFFLLKKAHVSLYSLEVRQLVAHRVGNGSGTCAWSWDISSSRRPYASPSSLLPSCRRASRLPSYSLPHLGMGHPPLPPPGKRVASRGKTFLSSLMGRSAVQQVSSFTPMSGVEKPTAACACVCGQHSQLPSVPAARAVSMEWQCDSKAAPGECAVASRDGRFCSSPLA
jgi:hypothetical protein